MAVFMNQVRDSAEVPRAWKSAKVILIPKQEKKVSLANLRPISLTSCIGKLMEKVVLTWLAKLLEDSGALP